MKRIFLFFIISSLYQCGNAKSPYPTENDIASDKTEVEYNTYTLLLFEDPFRVEFLYSFFNFLENNGLNMAHFVPLNIKDPLFSSKVSTALRSIGSQQLNILFFRVEEEKVRAIVPQALKQASKKLHLFPEQKPEEQPGKSIILPENYHYKIPFLDQIQRLRDPTFLGNMMKILSESSITKKMLPLAKGDILYLQGKTFPEAGIQFLIKSDGSPFKERKKSVSTKKGEVFGLLLEKEKAALIQIQHQSRLISYYALNLEHSFLYFDFMSGNKDDVNIYSFFVPIDLSKIKIQNKYLNLSMKDPIYHIRIKKVKEQQELKGSYKDGSLSFELGKESFPLYYTIDKSDKNGLQLENDTTIYDFEIKGQKNPESKDFFKKTKMVNIQLKDEI